MNIYRYNDLNLYYSHSCLLFLCGGGNMNKLNLRMDKLHQNPVGRATKTNIYI